MASKQRKVKDRLINGEGNEEEGFSNPVAEEVEMTGTSFPSGGESSAETIDETLDAQSLVKDLKTRRHKKQRELSKEVQSPKDDLSRELRAVKKKSKQKIEESEKQEEEEVADDGTVPMPIDSEDIVDAGPAESTVTFEDEEPSRIKKLKKKKEVVETTEVVETPPPSVRSPEPEEETTLQKTPRSMSLRERMKNRLQKAKEEAVSEMREEAREERKEKRLKDLRDKKGTRFDTGMNEAELEKYTEEKASKLRLRWKKTGQTLQEKTGVYIPTAEESFDFFTRVWEPEPEPEPAAREAVEEGQEPGPSEEEDKDKEEEKEEKEEDETAKETEKEEDKVPLLDDIDDEGFGIVAIRKAEYIEPDEQIEKESKILFYPSGVTIPPEKKIFEENLEPRFLEEEGFYVGSRPSIATGNKNKMEHRLIRQLEYIKKEKKNKDEEEQVYKWFGEDGCLIALPDPLKPTPSRPPMEDDPEPCLETVYRKAMVLEHDNRYIDGAAEGTGNYQLVVDINSIAFTHHHYFSREHVLATRLNELYNQYLLRRKKNMTDYLTEKLRALKSSTLHLQDHILSHKSEHTEVDRENYNRRLMVYKSEIRETRVQRDREEKNDRSILKSVINVWKEIKHQREFQKFTNTPAQLKVVKEEVDKSFDQLKWKQEMDDEMEELRDAHEMEYNNKMVAYQEQMAKWQQQQDEKKAAKSRQKKKKKKKPKRTGSRQSLTAEQDDQTEEDEERDQEILNEEDLPKPDLPEKFDDKGNREKIRAKAMEIRRRPGEPKIYLELTNTATVTPSNQCQQGEIQRREAVSKCKFFLKVLFNNKEVSRTVTKPLSQDFRVNFAQIYSLKIIQWPESIRFQVYETIGLSTQLLAEFCSGIPEISVTSQNVQLEELEFSSDHCVHHSHEGVGSGVPFTFGAKGTELLTLMTTGSLSRSVAWGVDEEGLPLVPPVDASHAINIFDAMKKIDPLAAVGAAGLNDIQKLQKWFENSKLDPNDPSNADLVFLLRPRGGNMNYLTPVEYFRLEQLQEEFDLCTYEDIANNKRFQLLEYRDQEIQEFRNLKFAPVYEREIPRDMFTDYEKKKRDEEKLRHSEDIESHRAAVARYMQRTREQVIRRFRILSHQKKLEDMVREDEVPNIAMIGTSILRLTERRRPLKPERKERKRMATQVIKGDEARVQVLVNIVRALYIPIRSAPPALTGGGMTARGGEAERKGRPLAVDTLVRPFIEVVFQHNTKKTSIGDGPNPSFNEELEVPFRAPNDDYSPGNLQTVNDIIFLNLFDEVVVDILEDDKQRETNIHQRVEKKWLGSLKIPFSTVYFNGKIEGTFRMDVPPVLLGYTYGQDSADIEMGIGKEGNTYLSLFLTIDPPLIPAEPMKEKFSTNEDDKLMQYAEKWQSNLESKFPKRSMKTTVIDVNGKSVFITRYFKALKPPEELLSKSGSADVTAELVARYVSLIPFVSDSVVFPGLCDIWSTCDQFLKMLAGDEEEHAVILTNFFLAMNKKAWLIIGSAIPEGPTAYVLTEEATDYWIWNAATGQHFSYRENYCPLQSVSCLINNENIWANIQQYEKPAQMSFNISNKAHWTPIFNGGFTNPRLGSIQPEALYYFTTDKTYVTDLQEKIEQTLKNKIMEWRSRYITRWNRHCTQIMRRLLPILEENRGKTVDQQHLQELEQTFGSYKVTGFPLNMPFVELNSVVEAVYATGAHAQESSDVEYALAVYIEPYPNSVLSVWVYVASLIRLR